MASLIETPVLPVTTHDGSELETNELSDLVNEVISNDIEHEADSNDITDNTKEPAENNDVIIPENDRTSSAERELSPAKQGDSSQVAALLTKAVISDKSTSGKHRRKEDKGIGKEELKHVLKALSSLETTEEKLAALCKKYTELLDEHRLTQNSFKQTQRRLNTLSREKDQIQTEQSKTVLAKSKLESLCRELQKHNKVIKDESMSRAKEEEERRKEVTAKFQATINDIQTQMNENYEKNNKLREENMELATKLKNLIEQYELREQHIEKVFKHKDLEHQLVDAKLAQANLQMTEEKEQNMKEKQLMLEAAVQAQKKIELLQAQEKQLRNQVALYTEKYEEFQTTLSKSNEVFQSFKSEMDKMTKKIKKLERETAMWRTRWENSNKALIEMAEQKTRTDKETSLLNSKVNKLESLCRALQEERKKMAAKISDAAAPAVISASQPVADTHVQTKTPPNTPEAGSSRASPVTVNDEHLAAEQPDPPIVEEILTETSPEIQQNLQNGSNVGEIDEPESSTNDKNLDPAEEKGEM